MVNVLKSGFFTTVQDAGRYGYRDKGVPISGVMDAFSAFQVNSLLENGNDAAVLEITMTGPTLEFQEATYIALGGAEMLATINDG
ncbi:MAG TPA: KipI antagonist, partial [Arenibacter sp.]|nr:KipI antagonist [Arenibacter sp.]